nr:RES family NAD+ phosphorylase [Pelomonas sp. P7]
MARKKAGAATPPAAPATAPGAAPLSPPTATPATLSGASKRPPAAHVPTVRDLVPADWYRVHEYDAATGAYDSTAFNGSGRGNARFSPLVRPDGSVIPTLYAAQAPRTAIAEILFHDAPYPSTGWTFDWSSHDDPSKSRTHMSIVSTPPLKLASLTTFGLQAAGLEVHDLLAGNSGVYPVTREWALWFYEQMPAIQGLYWMSRRDNEHACIMLFGDRVSGLKRKGREHISAYEADVLNTLVAMNAGIT